MKALVVYESLWGNTGAVARAIAEGMGPGAQALSTAQATAAEIAGADLIVAGAPVLAFRLPTEQVRESIGTNPSHARRPPDLSHMPMREWLRALAPGRGRFAAFETRIWWSPGGATKGIAGGLERAGYRSLARRERFIVKGTYGPLREGELDRARLWGAELARLMA